MPEQGTNSDIPINRDSLETALDNLQMTQHDTLEKMIETLHEGNVIEPKLFQEAMESIEELGKVLRNWKLG